MQTVFLRDFEKFIAALLIGSLVACSSAGSLDSKGAKSQNPANLKKSGPSDGAQESEMAEADTPQEIAGGFLTCAYVSHQESGFAESEDSMPVGCALMKNGRKLRNPKYSFKVGLYNSDKKPEKMPTKPASSSSKWHGYGHLGRVGKTDHLLGMVVTDVERNESFATFYFPVKDLGVDTQEAMLSLVGGYESAGSFDMAGSFPKQAGDFGQEISGITVDNKKTPILPLAACDQGTIRPEYDPRQSDDPWAMVFVFGSAVGKIADIDQLKTNSSQREKKKPKNISCFVLAREAAKEKSDKIFGKPRPVVEGEGCLILQSPEGFVIYDQQAIRQKNIKKEYLEAYVQARFCPDAKQ